MKKTSMLLGLAAFVIGGAALLPQAVSAYRGDPSLKGPNFSEERHAAMEQAFENNDYTAWKTLMAVRGRASEVVTPENFSRFAEAHQQAEAGNFEEARKIRAELGLGMQNGSGMHQGMGYGRMSP